jgi:hypothetical protein
MEVGDSSPAEVSRVAVRIPPFWAERPVVWFAQAEAQFNLVGISSEKTKFCHVISSSRRLSPRESNASASSLSPKRWATVSRPNFGGSSGALLQTSQTTASEVSDPIDYPQCTGHYRRSARGQLGLRSPLCGPHLRGRAPAGAR